VIMKRKYGERTLALMLAQVTRDHPDRPRLCINTWGLISEFAPEYFDGLVVEQFRGGTPVAVRMLTDPPLELIGPLESGIGELQAAACDVLRLLLPLNDCLEFAELDVVTAIVNAMRNLASHEELQFKSTIVLGLATSNEANIKLLLSEPSIGAIVHAMNIFPHSEDVAREGFTALARMGTWECAHRQLSHEGAFDNYIVIYNNHRECEAVMAPAAQLLENCIADDNVRSDIMGRGLTGYPLSSLEKFPGNREIVCALQKIAVFPQLRNILTAAGAVERVTRLMRPFVNTDMEHEYSDLLVKLSIEADDDD